MASSSLSAVALYHQLKTAEPFFPLAARVGVPLVFKSSFDKATRTSSASFRGPSLEQGLSDLRNLEWMREANCLASESSPGLSGSPPPPSSSSSSSFFFPTAFAASSIAAPCRVSTSSLLISTASVLPAPSSIATPPPPLPFSPSNPAATPVPPRTSPASPPPPGSRAVHPHSPAGLTLSANPIDEAISKSWWRKLKTEVNGC